MWAIYRQVMGTWQEDTVPPRFKRAREPTPLGVLANILIMLFNALTVCASVIDKLSEQSDKKEEKIEHSIYIFIFVNFLFHAI